MKAIVQNAYGSPAVLELRRLHAEWSEFDLILDNVANRSFSDCRRALTPRGILVPNSAHAGMGYILKALVRSAFTRQQGRPFVSVPSNEDLVLLKGSSKPER